MHRPSRLYSSMTVNVLKRLPEHSASDMKSQLQPGLAGRPPVAYTASNSALMLANKASITLRSWRNGCMGETRSSRLMELNITPWKFCVLRIFGVVCVAVAVAHIVASALGLAGDFFNSLLKNAKHPSGGKPSSSRDCRTPSDTPSIAAVRCAGQRACASRQKV